MRKSSKSFRMYEKRMISIIMVMMITMMMMRDDVENLLRASIWFAVKRNKPYNGLCNRAERKKTTMWTVWRTIMTMTMKLRRAEWAIRVGQIGSYPP